MQFFEHPDFCKGYTYIYTCLYKGSRYTYTTCSRVGRHNLVTQRRELSSYQDKEMQIISPPVRESNLQLWRLGVRRCAAAPSLPIL